ncbi:hypothetical protein Tco_1402588 [Tanacetum coccineum]
MGTFRETLAEGNEGALHLGPERARVYSDLSPEYKERYNADIRATNILLQGLPKDIYTLINHYIDAKDIWDNVKMLLEGSKLTKEDRESQLYDDFEHFRQNKGETIHDYYLYAYLKQHEAHANKNKMMLERFTQHTVDPLTLMSNVSPQQYSSQSSTTPPSTHVPLGNNARRTGAAGNGELRTELGMQIWVKQGKLSVTTAMADECDAFNSDVDEAPTAQTMFMANQLSTDPVYDEAGPSYDSDILSEVHHRDNYQDAICEHHEVHEMHDDVQPNCIVESDAEYTGNSNMIPYDQYVKDNAKPVVQNNVSFVPNDAYMKIINEMHEQTAQCVYVKAHNKVVDASLTTKLVTYKEQVELYERLAKFELTEREQKIQE